MKNELKGELSIFVSCFFFAIVAILIKCVPPTFNSLFISVFRFIVTIVLSFFILKLLKQKFKVYDKKDWILRGVIGSTAMILYYTAIQLTSSGRASLLFCTYPIFVALFGFFIFKEKISKWTIISLISCIVGIICVFYDGSKYKLSGDIVGLLGGILAGLTIHYIKRSRKRNHSVVVYLSACFFGLWAVPFAYSQFTDLGLSSFTLLFAITVFSLIAQTSMTYGYKYVSPTKGSIISYTGIPLVLVLSYFMGEEFKSRFFLGIILIIGGLLINRKGEDHDKRVLKSA